MTYTASSPYYLTTVVNNSFLDVMVNRPIFADPTDVYWQIEPIYNLRPDLFAYDMYNNAGLWWVFSQRNPNTLMDPLFDFVEGTYIFVPKYTAVQQALGL
jgi:hypothetical protein